MDEPLREIYAIRDEIYEETKDLSPDERREYYEQRSREVEADLLRMGYRYVPVEGNPNSRRLVKI